MHVHDDDLRALVDGELDRQTREQVQTHLQACTRCRQRLASMQAEIGALNGQLAALAPDATQRSSTNHALERLQAQSRTNHSAFRGGITLNTSGLSRNWRRALSGLATVAVVAVLLSFPTVRAAASELLAVFRLERIVVLPVSLYDIERLETASYELGNDYFPGQMEVLTEPGEAQHPETLDEAGEVAGFALRAPAALPPADEIVVRGEMVTRYEPDLEAMQELFEAAELSPDLVPPEIDGQPFTFTVPASVVQFWGAEAADPLVMFQMPSPTVEFPDAVDTQALGEAMLQLLGLSPEEAASLSASIDWSTTLLLPVPSDQVSAEPVAVDGAEGFLLSGAPPEQDTDVFYTALLWQKGGIVYMVAGTQDSERMLEIANSLQ